MQYYHFGVITENMFNHRCWWSVYCNEDNNSAVTLASHYPLCGLCVGESVQHGSGKVMEKSGNFILDDL